MGRRIHYQGLLPGHAPARPLRRALLVALAAMAFTAAAGDARRVILVVGDSLSAEYGLPRDSGWVRLLAGRVARDSPQYSVVNSSISGDTTSGGRSRLGALLAREHPAVVIIELGANDGLRGLAPAAMQENLQAMITACTAAHARVLLVGMRLPPNYGQGYLARFEQVYPDLARRNGVALVPFLMEGFADRMEWFQPDHLHPLAQAQAAMMENVWKKLRGLL